MIDLLVAVEETGGVIAGSEQDALYAVLPRRFEGVVTAGDVGAQDHVPRSFDREAAEMHDRIHALGHARMSAMRAMSPGIDFSPAASFFTGLRSESRRLYLPASSRRRCVPTSPAAPVMRMVFMASCSDLLPGSGPGAP